MREHAALGARISADVLGEGQLNWIAGHHERPDGAGYPRGSPTSSSPRAPGCWRWPTRGTS